MSLMNYPKKKKKTTEKIIFVIKWVYKNIMRNTNFAILWVEFVSTFFNQW